MTIQRSGPIKFSEIATEFPLADYDGNAVTTNKFSDFYRGRVTSYVHSGTANIPTDTTDSNDADNPPLSISNFYNTSSSEYLNFYIDEANPIESSLFLDYLDKVNDEISVSIIVVIANRYNTECLDFLDELYDNDVNGWRTSGLPRGRTGSTPNVNGIGYISSQNYYTPAIKIQNIPSNSFIWIRNFGYIVGAGGDGGQENVFSSNTNIFVQPLSGDDGGTGGKAIDVFSVDDTCDVLIENWGTIAGGAGGGGAGGDGGLPDPLFLDSGTFVDAIGEFYTGDFNYRFLENDAPSNVRNYFFVLRIELIAGFSSYRAHTPIWIMGMMKDGVILEGVWKVAGTPYYDPYGSAETDGDIYYNLMGNSMSSTDYGIITYLFPKYISDTFGSATLYGNWPSNADDITKTSFYNLSDANYHISNNPNTSSTYYHTVWFDSLPVNDIYTKFYNSDGQTLNDVYGPPNVSWGGHSNYPYNEYVSRNISDTSSSSKSSFYTGLYIHSYTPSNIPRTFESITQSGLTVTTLRGSSGGNGAHFKNFNSSSTTQILGGSGLDGKTSTKITTPNKLNFPEWYFGNAGAGVNGNGWAIDLSQKASPSLSLIESTATTSNNGDSGTDTAGQVAGGQGNTGTAVNIFNSNNVILNNY